MKFRVGFFEEFYFVEVYDFFLVSDEFINFLVYFGIFGKSFLIFLFK